MSCPRERELALYVEDDLPLSEVAVLQAHVLDCPVCRSFLLSLETSQQALKALAAEPIADEVFTALHSRAFSVPAADRRSLRIRWAFAAAVIVALLPGAFLAFSRLRLPATAPSAKVAVAAPGPVPRPFEVVPSVKAPEPVATAGRSRAVRARTTSLVPAELSHEEAVALATAVVAVSRIRSVDDVRTSGREQEPAAVQAPLVRMATDDPNVVIYWRIESSGGK